MPPQKANVFSDLSRLYIFLKLRVRRRASVDWERCQNHGRGMSREKRASKTEKPLSSETAHLRMARQHYLELLVSLPQHSGRAGKEERSQPPPSAWIRRTALVIRRPRILTAVTSSVRAALCAVVTSR